MNAHAPEIDRDPTEDEARAARDLLRRFEASRGGALSTSYPDLVTDDAYRARLPDVQNGPASAIRGDDRPIQHVGIAGFRLPMRAVTRHGEPVVQVAVTGTVGLEAGRKGINMSRILRRFYERADAPVGFAVAEAVLDDYARDGSDEGRLALRCSLPLPLPSLRSGLVGWQYYDVVHEAVRGTAARGACCTSTTSIPPPAPARWRCPSTRARSAASSRRRIRSAPRPASRSR